MTSSFPGQPVVADFTGDGNLDIVVPDANNADLVMLLGNGDGTFHTGATFVTGALLDMAQQATISTKTGKRMSAHR